MKTMSDQVRLWDILEEALKPIARRSESDARDVYRALCNVAWVPFDHPAKTYDEWGFEWPYEAVSMSWRAAGGFVADLRREGEDYMDFYCSGGEGTVTDEIRKTLEEKGLRPLV